MPRNRGAMRAATALIAIACLAACQAAPATPAGSAGQAGPGASSGETAGLPDLGFANVRTERDAARAATIGPDGGTVAVTAHDGTAYSLAVPAGALDAPTSVAMYPVESLSGLPGGAALRAGVQFGPEGLRLLVPAKLTITLPAGAEASGVGAVAWNGDGARAHTSLAVGAGGTVTMSIFHFSGVGLTPGDLALALGCDGVPDVYGCEIDSFLATISADARKPDARSLLLRDLRFAYAQIVEPAFVAGENYLIDLAGDAPDSAREDTQAYPYLVWLDILDASRIALHDPTLTVAPELDESKQKAASFLRDWFEAENGQCTALKEDVNVRLPLHWAFTAVGHAEAYGHDWAIDTQPNELDEQTLLDDLCVQVALDPEPTYSARRPGDSGEVKVTAGFTIAGGPLRFLPNPVRVTIQLRGASTPLFDHDTESDGTVSVPDVAWPADKDPIHFDVSARLTDDVGGTEVLTPIRRLAGITRGTVSEIAFTSAIPGHSQVEVVDSDGSGSATEVTTGPLDLTPSWSPDGSKIAFARARNGIWTVNANGTDAKQLLADPSASDPVWSPDGTQIAFQRAFPGSTNGRGQIALMQADGTNIRDTAVYVFGGIAWSPDGTRIAYAANDNMPITMRISGRDVFFHPFRIWLYDLSGGGSTKLTTHECEPYGAFDPAWSPDGSQIAIDCATSGGHPTRVGTIPAGGGPLAILWTAPDDLPYQTTWSPDGSRLAIGARRLGILVFNVGGGGSAGPTTIGGGTDAIVESLDWSP